MDLLAPHNTPFAVALALLALLLVVQVSGVGHLFGADGDTDVADADLGGGLMSLVGLGKLPLIVWLSCLLACFALIGLSLQELLEGLLGAPLPALAATGLAAVASLPINAALVRALSWIWPHDETTALPVEALVGRRGTITDGRAARGSPARAGIRDRHGQLHLVMVEPHEDGIAFDQGQEVLLVRREGERFYAIDGQGPIRLG